MSVFFFKSKTCSSGHCCHQYVVAVCSNSCHQEVVIKLQEYNNPQNTLAVFASEYKTEAREQSERARLSGDF